MHPESVIIQPDAEADLAAAMDWYESRRPGLGQAFLLSVEATLAQIAGCPNRTRPCKAISAER